MITFSRSKALLSLPQIEEIEKHVGLDFPTEYKEHLLKYNGGQCSPNVFSFNENGKNTESFVDWFLAIYDGEYNNLKNYIEICKIEEKRLPLHILPIAHDPEGNLICLSCGSDDKGCVYFWDHENEINYTVADNSNYSNLYLIARSFNDFIDGLKEDLS